MSSKPPAERIWGYGGLKKQIAYELSWFNLNRVSGEYQKSYAAFGEILKKLIYDKNDPPEIEIDIPKAQEYLDLFEGTDKITGLYALDIIERKTEGGKYGLICRGLGETDITKATMDPEFHHKQTMEIRRKIDGILFPLWHKIAKQVEDEGTTGIKLKWGMDTPKEAKPKTSRDDKLIQEGTLQQFPQTFEELVEGIQEGE